MGTCRSRCTSSTSEVPWSSMIRRKCATALGSSASLLRSWTNASGGTPGSGTLTAPPEPKSQYIDVGDHSHSLTGRHRIEGQSTKEFLHVRCHLHLPRRGAVRDTAGRGDRMSVVPGTSVPVSVDLSVRRIITTNTTNPNAHTNT